ncbi:MAG: Hsp70 family protein [Clostridia bacterium]|nr:Hsp70 family protein [Clostridia bacterium]
MAKAYLGLDFGTTNSVMAKSEADSFGRITVNVIKNQQRQDKTPSVVLYDNQGIDCVGTPAINALAGNLALQSYYFSSVKRSLGRRVRMVLPNEIVLSPSFIAAEILKKMKDDAETLSFNGAKLTSVVLTYPVTFSPAAKVDLQNAAKQAGFQDVTLLEEPVAAALGYKASGAAVRGNIFIIDIGGGTLDIAFLQEDPNAQGGYSVISDANGRIVGGLALGGDDIDQKIYDWWNALAKQNGGKSIDIQTQAGISGVNQYALSQCRQGKETLGATTRPQTLSLFGNACTPQLNRAVIAQEAKKEIGQMVGCVTNMVQRAKAKANIGAVLLIGGSTRLIGLKESIDGVLRNAGLPQQALLTGVSDEAVALGAAYYALKKSIVNFGTASGYLDGTPDQVKSKGEKKHHKTDEDPSIDDMLSLAHKLETEKKNNEALWQYKQAADQGSAEAMYRAGCFYEEGNNGANQNYDKALEWYQKAADCDHAEAMYKMGLFYEYGKGVSKDDKKALALYLQAAGRDKVVEAMYRIGLFYEAGRGMNQDYNEALKWYKKASDYNHAEAMYKTALLYEGGNGTKQDYVAALEWYKKAAGYNHAEAMYKTALLYEGGNGTEQDYNEALKWYQKAAECNHVEAMYRIAFIHESVKHYDEALNWYRMAIEQEHTEAMYRMGLLYENGKGVSKDDKKALEFYKQAAKRLNLHAIGKMGTHYFSRLLLKELLPLSPWP